MKNRLKTSTKSKFFAKSFSFTSRQLAYLISLGVIFSITGCKTEYFVIHNGDRCPDGTQPATYLDATMNRDKICPLLGEWEIARLRHGGSMDGAGYGCNARAIDTRNLGTTICRKAVVIEISTPPIEIDETDSYPDEE